ncbi:MAG: sigma-70 family RNA polymerase sigma factor [Planctomycetota bacterium]|nr:MAG: sigma-70 family RNA polymerase sigma factor [Planctomycetota bacterium]
MPTAEDQSWIRDAIARYEGPLLRYAAGLTRDRERARDVVQDTFMRLCRAERAAVERRLAPWLYTVCRNRAIDVCRKEGRMGSTTDEAAVIGHEAEPAAAVEARETHSRALDLIGRLPDKQREVIRLKFQSGLTYAQIAEVTSLSVSHVGVLIHHGMKTLRGRMGALASDARGTGS